MGSFTLPAPAPLSRAQALSSLPIKILALRAKVSCMLERKLFLLKRCDETLRCMYQEACSLAKLAPVPTTHRNGKETARKRQGKEGKERNCEDRFAT